MADKTSKALALPPRDCAELLSVSMRTIYRMIARGDLPHIRLGKSVRVPRKAIDDLLSGAG